METKEESLKLLVKQIGLLLKPYGYKKNGSRFVKENNGNLNVIEIIVIARFKNKLRIAVSANIYSEIIGVWHGFQPWKDMSTKDKFFLSFRSGVIAGEKEEFWELFDNSSFEQRDQIVDVVCTRLVPFLVAHGNDQGLFRWVEEKGFGLSEMQRNDYRKILGGA